MTEQKINALALLDQAFEAYRDKFPLLGLNNPKILAPISFLHLVKQELFELYNSASGATKQKFTAYDVGDFIEYRNYLLMPGYEFAVVLFDADCTNFGNGFFIRIPL
jgi:hypothetical protein